MLCFCLLNYCWEYGFASMNAEWQAMFGPESNIALNVKTFLGEHIQFKVDVLDNAGQNHDPLDHRKSCAGACSRACSKWQKSVLEIFVPRYTNRLGGMQVGKIIKSLWFERIWIFPNIRIPVHWKLTYKNERALRYHVPIQLGILACFTRKRRHSRIESKGFEHNLVGIFQRTCLLISSGFPLHYKIDLLTQCRKLVRVFLQKLEHETKCI
mmetsp:Transcript_4974/g.10349  ORF Transcript_4974/g.10349 Transcript_4974/m.10349 type:complete len:211 (+) Transcript_4974:39-671(+)